MPPSFFSAKTGGVLHVTCSAPPGLHSIVCFSFIFIIYLTFQAVFIYKNGDGDDDDDDDDDE